MRKLRLIIMLLLVCSAMLAAGPGTSWAAPFVVGYASGLVPMAEFLDKKKTFGHKLSRFAKRTLQLVRQQAQLQQALRRIAVLARTFGFGDGIRGTRPPAQGQSGGTHPDFLWNPRRILAGLQLQVARLQGMVLNRLARLECSVAGLFCWLQGHKYSIECRLSREAGLCCCLGLAVTQSQQDSTATAADIHQRIKRLEQLAGGLLVRYGLWGMWIIRRLASYAQRTCDAEVWNQPL